MPRYKTISRWLDKQAGQYVDPPTEVELDEARGEKLVQVGCLAPLHEIEAATGGNVESPPSLSGPPPAEIEEGKKPTRRRKAKKAGD